MNTVQVSDNQIVMIWFSCLAVLHCPMTVEDKIKTLEAALMNKILENNQTVPVVQTGLEPFDKALMGYATTIEQRFKGIDLSKISTGSDTLDAAFKNRIEQLIGTNFSETGL